MVSDPKMNVGKRRRLAPSEKYEIYVAVLTGQATQREAAERFGVDRSTVVHVCRTAKQGALAALAASVPGRPVRPRRGGGGRRVVDRAGSGVPRPGCRPGNPLAGPPGGGPARGRHPGWAPGTWPAGVGTGRGGGAVRVLG